MSTNRTTVTKHEGSDTELAADCFHQNQKSQKHPHLFVFFFLLESPKIFDGNFDCNYADR